MLEYRKFLKHSSAQYGVIIIFHISSLLDIFPVKDIDSVENLWKVVVDITKTDVINWFYKQSNPKLKCPGLVLFLVYDSGNCDPA